MDCYNVAIPILKALCDETRVQILVMLSKADMNACEINKSFCCTQPTISYHMRLLVDTGLVCARREGCQVIYSVNSSLWPSIQALLTALCEAQRAKT
ncbi:MAG: metalloregulator ArsR/SmtB family transcription factor [Candidatus Limiplasma sp.]|nr:metalloregulator ArsR/SmtB family transcription factor [Candidatus Limiplasma sp.]